MIDKRDKWRSAVDVSLVDHGSRFFIVKRDHESVWDSIHGDRPAMGEPLPLLDVEAVQVTTYLPQLFEALTALFIFNLQWI